MITVAAVTSAVESHPERCSPTASDRAS
ncbi:MAG: hypothetical protein QOK06_1579, partial [Acidimicrobiaceae bacterium]